MPCHQTESAHQKKVVEHCRKLGLHVVKVQQTSENGWPDLFIAIPGGKPLLLEMKKPGEKPTKLQLEIHDQLRKIGYNVQWADCAVNGKKLVDDAMVFPRAVAAVTMHRNLLGG